MKNTLAIFSMCLLGVLASAYSPHASLTSVIPNTTIKVNETRLIDLNDHFTGFNLHFATDIEGVVVQQPITVIKGGSFDIATVPGSLNFISQNYPRNFFGNLNYNSRILYVLENNVVYWATLANSTTSPTMNDGLQVTRSKYVHCYDADVLTDVLIVVDCSSIDPATGTQSDWFYFVNVTSRTVVNTVSNTASTNTTWNNVTSNSTRGVRVADYGNGNRFIFRFVGEDAIANPDFKNDSYVEVWKAYNATNPEVYTIINKNNLGADALWLASFEILNDSLFILCACGKAYQINNFKTGLEYNNTNTVFIPGPARGLTTGIESDGATQRLTVLIYNDQTAYEYDWTAIKSPIQARNYSLGNDSIVHRADFSKNFVHIHFANGSLNNSLSTVRRGLSSVNGTEQLHHFVNVPAVKNTVFWSLDRALDNVILHDVGAKYIHNLHYNKPYLFVNSSNVVTRNLTIWAVSLDRYNNTDNFTVNSTFPLVVINETDFNITKNTTDQHLTVDHPSTHTITLDNAVYGPAVVYSSPNGTNVHIRSIEALALNTTGINFESVNFNQIAANGSNSGEFNWVVQDGQTLFNYLCSEKLNTTAQAAAVNCTLLGSVTVVGQVTSVAIASQYIALITTGQNGTVYFYAANLTVLNTTVLGDGSDINACNDLTLTPKGLLLCSQPVLKQITVWTSYLDATPRFINRSIITTRDAGFFSPKSVEVNSFYPNVLFINNNVEILIVDVTNFISSNVVSVIGNLSVPDAFLQAPNFDFVINGNSILLFLIAGGQTTLREFTLVTGLSSPTFVKDYSNIDNSTFQFRQGAHYSSDFTQRFFSMAYVDSATPTLLAFQAGAPANNNYLRSLPVGANSTQSFLAGVRSSVVNGEYLIVVNSAGQVFPWLAYDSTSFTFSSSFTDATQAEEQSDIVLTATSLITKMTENVVFHVQTLNSQPPIVPGKRANDSNALNFINIVASTSNNTEFAFEPSDFFGGVITQWTLTPEKPEDVGKVVIQTAVSRTDSLLNTTEYLTDIVHVNKSVYGQGVNSLVYILPSGEAKGPFEITVSAIPASAMVCTHLVVTEIAENKTVTVSYCLNNQTNLGYLVPVSFLSDTDPNVMTAVATGFGPIDSMQIIGETLFILTSDGSNSVLTSNSELHYFTFASPAKITYLGKVDGSIFGSNTIQIGDFDVLYLGDTTYRFYFTDARFGIRTAEWNGAVWTQPQSVNLFNHPDFTKDNLTEAAHFVGVRVVKNDTNNNTFVALTTDNYKVYYARLQSLSNGPTVYLLAAYRKITAANNNNKITSYNGGNDTNLTYFAVSSYNSVTNRGYITVYNASLLDNGTSVVAGGYVESIDFPSAANGSNAFSFALDNNTVKLWTYVPNNATTNTSVNTSNLKATVGDASNGTQSIAEYQIRPYYAIKVLDSNITSSYLNLTGANENSASTVQFKVTHNEHPDGKSGGLAWWAWLLIVMGILVVIGAIIAFVRYRNQQKEELDHSNDANAPLTTNYA